MPRSRAIRVASILPSIPRSPKPPGIRIPSAHSAIASGSKSSESTSSTSTLVPWW